MVSAACICLVEGENEYIVDDIKYPMFQLTGMQHLQLSAHILLLNLVL